MSKRFPQLTLDDLAPEPRALAEAITKFSSVGIAGPYNVMLRSPVLADRLKKLLDYLRFENSLPLRLTELAILIQARLWTSQVEWYAHHPLAVKAGLAESVCADIKARKRPAEMQPDEAVVYDFCMELCARREVSDETFARARAIFSEQQVVDLMAVSGTYVLLAMLLNVSEEGVPAGKELPFGEKPVRS